MVSMAISRLCDTLFASVAVTVRFQTPDPSGVPVMVPSGCSVKPGGSACRPATHPTFSVLPGQAVNV